MLEPVQHRDLDLLHPDFRSRFEAWLEAARAAFPSYVFGVHETLRSQERQDYLYSIGRTRPGRKVTWVRRSKHQDGLAADWHLAQNGRALWEAPLYRRVYSTVPPADYGLQTLEGDLVHLELADDAEQAPAVADRLLVVLNEQEEEVFRLPLPAGADVLTRYGADGSRVYVRPDL